MKRLDKFILKAYVGPFVAILLVVVFILMMQFLWLYIDELVGKGLSLSVIMEFMMWGGCTILPLALPLATLLSSMMAIGQMAENNELLAIKAAGISLARVMMPIAVCAVFISIGAYFAGNDLVPKAFNEIYTLRDDIGRTKDEIKIPSGTFYDGIDGYVLRVESQNDRGMLYDVIVYDHHSKGNTSVTIADSAEMKMSSSKDYLTFALYNGSSYIEDNTWRGRDTSFNLQRINFEAQELIIPLTHYAFEKSEDNRFSTQSKTMNLKQLLVQHDSLRNITDNAVIEHYDKLNASGMFLVSDQLDSANFKSQKGFRDFSHKEYMEWKTFYAKSSSFRRAAEKAMRMSSTLSTFNNEVYEPYFYLRRTDIEILKKFAQALACFILFFIGAPLGAIIRKGGLGTSAIVSVLFFVLYWVVDISGTKLARDGAVTAFNGVFISAYVLIPIGLLLCWKAIHDTTSGFDMDNIKSAWRTLSSKVTRLVRPVRIVYMGTPEFAVAPLEAIIKARYKVVGVVTVADKPAGRGLKLIESPVKRYAAEHNIPVLQPLKLKDPEFLGQLRALKADMFVVVAFRMLPQEVWSMPRLGTFNLHAALLPQYRGAAPINWAVINGERMTGVTTFMIDKDIDTGGIILRQECRIDPQDTAGDLHDKLMPLGAQLVVETIEGIVTRNVETRVQRSFIQGNEVLRSAPKLTRELCDVDWNLPGVQVCNLIRGLSPYPSAFTTLESADGTRTQLKIFNAAVSQRKGEFPGQILSDGKTYLAVATADASVELAEVQLSGKKRMKVTEFLLGFREPSSYKAVRELLD